MADDVLRNLPAEIVPIPLERLSALRHTPEFKANSTPVTFVQMNGYQDSGPVRTGRNYQAAVQEGYKRNELIFSCIYHKALALSGVRVRMERTGSDKEIPNHPMKALLDRPNPYWSWEDWIAATTIIQDCAGIAYYQKIRSRAGAVVQLWPMRPDWTHPVVTQSGLQGYEYQPPGSRAIPMRTNDVLALSIFDPLNMYGGLSPVQVLGNSGDTDNAMSSFMRAFYLEGGMPMIALTTEQNLLESDIAMTRANWKQRYGGWHNWFEPAVLSMGITVEKLNLSFAEMGYDEMDSRNESRICMVLGVPPIVIGAKVGLNRSTFANYAEARRSWWEDNLHPKLRFLRGQLSRDLLPEFGEGADLEWDLSEIPAFQDDENEIWTRALEHLRAGGIMVDEYRQMIAMDPLPDDAGQIFLRPSLVVEVPLGQLGEPTKSTVTPEPPPGSDVPVQTPSEVVPGDAGNAPPAGQKVANWPYDAKAAVAADAPDAKERRKHEQEFADELTAYFDGFRQRVAKELKT